MSDSQQYPGLLCLRGYPPELRDALADAAATAGLSVNTYAVGVLAAIYDVPFDTAGRALRARRSDAFAGEPTPPTAREPGSTLQIQLPPELNFRIHEQAMRHRKLIRDIVLGHLANHVGVPYAPPVIRRGRKKKVAA